MTQKHKFIGLTALCTAVYFVSYLSRVNLAAVMVELIQCGFAEKQVCALALTVCSVTYGLGQLLSGWMGDRFKPQNIILLGFLLTASMNLGVAILETASLLSLLWAVNGFAQACMWPPLVAILTERFDRQEYSRACVWVSQGSAFGTIFVYTFAPFLIRAGSFRSVFMFSGIAALGMALIWKYAYERWFADTGSEEAKTAAGELSENTAVFSTNALKLMGLIMLAIILQGSLRDGVSNWMPTFVSESFGLDGASAILTGVLLPVFQIPCTALAARFYQRHLSNETAAAGVIFSVGAVCALLLSQFLGRSVLATAVLMALLVGSMHGVNYMLISMAPRQFRRFGRVSLVSGALNSCTYVGSAISTYGIALLSETLGWQGTSVLWAVIAGGGALLCLRISKGWQRFKDCEPDVKS
jgi:OPA family glycerol-3-phosphate transporter-like MFS transporter